MSDRLEKLRSEHGTAGCTLVSVEDWAANEIKRRIDQNQYLASVVNVQRQEIEILHAALRQSRRTQSTKSGIYISGLTSGLR